MKISVVTSLYRSEAYLEEFCNRSLKACEALNADAELILVHDASPDDDLGEARRLAEIYPQIVIVDLSRNFGQHRALLTGIAQAQGDYIYVCDSDLEDEPEWIASFYEHMQESGSDVVYGVQSSAKKGPIYRFCRQIFYNALNLLSGIQFPKNITTARLMTRRYADALLQYKEREVFLAGIWHMVGFQQNGVAVRKHDTSPTTYGLRRLVPLFVNAVTAFSTRPLILIAVLGVAMSVIAMGIFTFVIAQRLMLETVSDGWTSTIATILLVGGLGLFCNGVIAIYIAKIFTEVKQRPLTTIRAIYGRDEKT